MRVLAVSSWFPEPADNGARLRARALLRGLAQRHDVTLLSFAEAGQASEDGRRRLAAEGLHVRTFLGNPHKPQAPLSGLRLFGRMPRSYAATWNAAMAGAIAEASVNADLILGLTIGSALYLPAMAGRPRVFEEAELGQVVDRRPTADGWTRRARHWLAARKFEAFTRHLVASCSRTTVVSRQEFDRLAQAGCDTSRVAIVPNGVDESCFTTLAPAHAAPDAPARDRLVYPGALTFDANRDAVAYFLGDVLPHLEARRGRVSLHVTGRYDGVDVSTLPRHDALRLTGHLPDVRPFVAQSAVCVVPLRRGGGTRIKILEAMALGVPVVATTKGVEGVDVKPGQHLLIADTPAAFAAAVDDVLQSPTLAAALAREAQALVRARYTWSHAGALLDEVLHQAVDAERRRSARR